MFNSVKNTTIATRTDILRGFFGWLRNEEYITKNPMDKIKTIKAESRIREPLTYEELEILRTGCKTLRQKCILEMFYSTCVRLDELVNMNIADVGFSEQRINVIGKGNKERTVYFNARTKVYLQKYLKLRNDTSPALFVTERAPIDRLGRRGVQREIKKIQEQSGLNKNIYPHLLRHSGSSHMLEKGIAIEVIQEILGHESLDTTRHYSKSSQSNIEYQYRKYMSN